MCFSSTPGPEEEYPNHSRTAFIASLPSDLRMDLNQQLKRTVRELMNHYASFVSRLRSSVRDRVTVDAMRSLLLGMSAFMDDYQGRHHIPLFIQLEADFQEAVEVTDFIDSLSLNYGSFLNYDIFRLISMRCGNEKDAERLTCYGEHRQDYIIRHKLSEFIEVRPPFGRHAETNEQLIVNFDIDLDTRIAQLLDIKTSFAAVVGLKGLVLRLFNVEQIEYIVVTFQLAPAIGEAVFSGKEEFTAKQMEEFRALSVQSIQYCDYVCDLRK